MSPKRKSFHRRTNRTRGANKAEQPIQVDEHRGYLADQYDIIFNSIDDHVRAASDLVSRLDPIQLLSRGYGEYSVGVMGLDTEVDMSTAQAIGLRMVDYVQCLIVATSPHPDGYITMTEELWKELQFHVFSIFQGLTCFFSVASAKRYNEGNRDDDLEMILTKAQMNWCYVKGNRHFYHFDAYLRSVLSIHNAIFNELFGITVDDFVTELGKVQVSLTRGIPTSAQEVIETHRKFFERLSEEEEEQYQSDEELGAFYRRKMEEYGYKQQFESSLQRFFGFDLFDLGKVTNLPHDLLIHLSLSPGEDTRFFAESEFKGWPLSLWPTWNKPFLKYQDKFYCFDIYGLSDNIYRAIQKIIIQQRPSYQNTWTDYQQEISEALPFELFDKLLPNATIYKNIYYTSLTGQNSKRNWAECDGLILYDDHLFIIEVKAGAFTYTPPATDAPAYINSIKALLFNQVDGRMVSRAEFGATPRGLSVGLPE